MRGRLHPADIEAIAEAVARQLHSGRPSALVVAASGQGDQCDERTENRKSMDPTSTEISGESMSLLDAEERGRQFMRRLKRGLSPTPSSPVRVTRRKASR